MPRVIVPEAHAADFSAYVWGKLAPRGRRDGRGLFPNRLRTFDHDAP